MHAFQVSECEFSRPAGLSATIREANITKDFIRSQASSMSLPILPRKAHNNTWRKPPAGKF